MDNKDNNSFLSVALISAAAILVVILLSALALSISSPPDSSEPTSNALTARVDTEKTESTAVGVTNQGSSLLLAILFVMSLAMVVSVGVSFYLYRWRKILLSQPNTVVPEKWAACINDLGDHIETLTGTLQRHLPQVTQEAKTNSERIHTMTKTYLDLHNALDAKDEEINRLKEGYDAEIFRKFIARFVRIDHALDDLMEEYPAEPSFGLLKRLMEDALAECGVEAYAPEIGSDYRIVEGVADNPKKVFTSDPSQVFTIAEIIETGYRLNAGTESKSIIPSKVKIYALEETLQ